MIDLRGLPSIDQLLQTRQMAALVSRYGRPISLDAVRAVLNDIREKAQQGHTIPHRDGILDQVREKLEQWLAPTLIPVINATGVILHTNLGRAPLSTHALQAVVSCASGYSSLEYDMAKGARGSRSVHAEALLIRLTHAEAATVVNNNAAAVLLVLAALSRRQKVLISRTQLVEIGGGFRIPEVMRQSSANLVEIGTTNRVNLKDYEQALQQDKISMVLHAHHSNFKIIGFTEEPPLQEVVELAHRFGVTVVDDLGSGALIDTGAYGLAHEPTVQDSIEAGVDLVCFSGDKLLGGPQAGIIVGRRDLLQKVKKHPLARAIRADKLCLAALSSTLTHYLKDEHDREIPVWRMICVTPGQLQARVKRWMEVTGKGKIISGFSTVGGGSMPGETLPTYLYAIETQHANKLLERLRAVHPPIIARIQDDCVVLDPRTVLPEQEGALLVGLQNTLSAKYFLF